MKLECKFCKYLDPSVEGYCYMFETEPVTPRKCAQCTPPDSDPIGDLERGIELIFNSGRSE